MSRKLLLLSVQKRANLSVGDESYKIIEENFVLSWIYFCIAFVVCLNRDYLKARCSNSVLGCERKVCKR